MVRDVHEGAIARMEIVKKIEEHLQVFIYKQDLETIVTFPRAFNSFLLSVAGKKLLEENQLNVSEIALQVGYSNSSHFIAAFKKKFNTTPKQFTKKNNNA